MNRDVSKPSAAVIAEVVNRAASPGYEEWWAKVIDSGFCAVPVRLARAGRLEQGAVLARCKNRRASVCPSCSQLYAGDTWRLVHAGMAGDEEYVAGSDGHPMVFATLTAPSFGAVHSAPRDPLAQAGSCRPGQDLRSCRHGRPTGCRKVHHLEDPDIGQPLCADCYDYLGHVLFTWHSPELWHRFTIVLRRLVGRHYRTEGHDPHNVRVSYVKVVELQRRAVPHFHAVIRLDHEGHRLGIDQAKLGVLVRQAGGQVALDVRTQQRSMTLRYGEQLHVRPLDGISAGIVAAYLAKYVTKSVGDFGLTARRLHEGVIDDLDVSDHVRQLLRTIAGVAREPDHRKLGAWLHSLGYRGHVTTKTRRYSTTMGELRARRNEWRRNQRHPDDQLLGVPEPAEWRYLSCGHANEGERFLAVSAAERAREMRRIAREELAG